MTHQFESEHYVFHYSEESRAQALRDVYGMSAAELNEKFVSYIKRFSIDPAVEKQMEALR